MGSKHKWTSISWYYSAPEIETKSGGHYWQARPPFCRVQSLYRAIHLTNKELEGYRGRCSRLMDVIDGKYGG